MCGILGIIGSIKEEDINWIEQSLISLKHRGPDAASSWIAPSKNAVFAHRRLSIIDTGEISNQPFFSDDNSLMIVFNGEIYNYIELRKELINLGHSFKSQGDTEVLLNAYREWGVKCLDRFNGMFAFAIWDARNGLGKERLFIARDRSGEKPFYYRYKNKKFEFSSELKGLRVKNGINLQAVNHYLSLGYIPGDLCIAQDVKKLPPAHAALLDVEQERFNIWRYWDIPKYEEIDDSLIEGEDLADKAYELLKESTRLRLRSDVPTGIFLSGGLDSSLVTAAATHASNLPIKTFTIGVPGSPMDETSHARLISDNFSTDHHLLEIEKPSLNLLNELAPFVDEPIADSSILPSFAISKLTRQHVKVALGGDGGDELFGGYYHYQRILRDSRFLGWIPKLPLAIISSLAGTLSSGIPGRNRIFSLRRGPFQSGIWGTPYFDIELRKKIFRPEVLAFLGKDLSQPELSNIGLLNNSKDVIENYTRLDFKQLLPDDYLVKVDRASMANSLEVRAPFLDHNLIEFAFKSIPSFLKCNLKERRIVQHLMAKRYLPHNFQLNRKQGFSVPMDQWIKNIPDDQLLEQSSSEIVSNSYIKELIIGQKKGRTNGARLFALMMLKLSLKSIT